MTKRIGLIALLAVMSFGLCACSNRKMVDMTYKFDTAIVVLADGSVVKGKCQNWLDFENSDMIQVKIDNKTYLVHSVNCTLIAE